MMFHNQTIHLTKFQKYLYLPGLSFEVKLPNQGQEMANYDLDDFDVEWCSMIQQYIWQRFRKIPAGVAEI